MTARPATTGVNNNVGQPFLSVTAKKEVPEAPTSKLGSLTVDGRKPVTAQSLVVKETVTEKVVKKTSDSYPEDSLKEIFKYKGNQPKPKDSGNNIDLSF